MKGLGIEKVHILSSRAESQGPTNFSEAGSCSAQEKEAKEMGLVEKTK